MGCREDYLHFGLEGGCMLSLEASAAKRDSPKILETHAIAMDRSPELRQTAGTVQISTSQPFNTSKPQ